MGDPIQQFYYWYRAKSIVSKLYFTSSLILFILMYLDFLRIQNIYLTMQGLQNLQIWRPFTAVFYQHAYSILKYPFKFYISYTILVNLQERVYGKQNAKVYAEFLWMLLIVWVYVTGTTLMFSFYITNHFFFLTLCCVYAKKRPNTQIPLVLGLSLPVIYLPFIYTIYYWIFGLLGFWYQVIAAFAFGYLYYYLKVYATSYYGKNYFQTPKIFELLVQKYLVLEQRFGLVRGYLQEQDDNGQDPYAQYGYQENER